MKEKRIYKYDERFNYVQEFFINKGYNLTEDEIKSLFKWKSSLFKARINRFRRKALMNEWNYFVTFTYDENKHDEISFVTKLKKCLANLYCNRNWRYMGCFERSKSGRLHFHGLIYVPKGEMIGNLEEIKDYSTEKHRMNATTINDFFLNRFGRNDFKRISTNDLKHDNTINYIVKYISKDEEKVFYSRGIKDTLVVVIHNDDTVIEVQKDGYVYYIFADDLLESENVIYRRMC